MKELSKEIIKTNSQPFSHRSARIQKAAEWYFNALRQHSVGEPKPSLYRAMREAGYAETTAQTMSPYLTKHPIWRRELEKHNYLTINYVETLESSRNKTLSTLAEKDLTKEKPRDLSQIFNTLDERLRLHQGLATENIAISAVLSEIEDKND